MRNRLLKKVRRYAETLFDAKLTRFETENGRVTGISYVHEFKWAFYWLLGERLDYHDDREKIVCAIARIAWEKFLRDKWTRKIRKDPRDADHNVCEVNRDRYREDAKMAEQARKMLYAAKEGGASHA